MTSMTATPKTTVLAAAQALLDRHPLTSHPYFSRLNGMDRSDFGRGQGQFFYAVRYFARALAALLARQPDSASRQVLMHNLAEEHGWDEERGGDFRPGMAHDQTFQLFLSRLGVQPGPQGPAVRAFNLALYGACSSEPVPLAFACLGMIEYAFADISAFLGKAVVERGWMSSEQLVHYSLHAEIDKRHAAELFSVVEEADREEVQAGLELGWHIFSQLYVDLL